MAEAVLLAQGAAPASEIAVVLGGSEAVVSAEGAAGPAEENAKAEAVALDGSEAVIRVEGEARTAEEGAEAGAREVSEVGGSEAATSAEGAANDGEEGGVKAEPQLLVERTSPEG